MAGQNNHFLITILVGLSAVEDGTAALKEEMRTSWAPHNRRNSAKRSRDFAIKAQLAWLVDALDAFVRNLRLPPSIANETLQKSLEEARSKREGVAGQVRAVAAASEQSEAAETVLLEIAISWRNHLVHHHAKPISKPQITRAKAHKKSYEDLYQGLVIDTLLSRAQRTPALAPTFKEITAIVRAAHKFVEHADLLLLKEVDLNAFLESILRDYLKASAEPASPSMNRVSNVWGKSRDHRRSTIRQIAIQNGFSPYTDAAPNALLRATLDDLSDLSPREAIQKLFGG